MSKLKPSVLQAQTLPPRLKYAIETKARRNMAVMMGGSNTIFSRNILFNRVTQLNFGLKPIKKTCFVEKDEILLR